MICSCLGYGACSPQDGASSQLGYSLAPGTVDNTPISPFGDLLADYPPEMDGSPRDFSAGKGVQAFADDMIGKRVADFALMQLHFSPLSSSDFHSFYPTAQRGPAPGMCRGRVYSVMNGPVDKPATPGTTAGEWQDDIFAVAGSVAPLPHPPAKAYSARLSAVCGQRRDMPIWFSAEPGMAVVAARLADLVVTAARRPETIPFALSCRPYPADIHEVPRCRTNVRRTVASINPRAIMRVGECFEIEQRPCLAVSIAKSPDQASLADEDQWTLNVQYKDASKLNIASVVVDDTQIVVD